MNMLLGFIPFAVFAIGERLLGVVGALAAAAVASLAIIVRDLIGGRTPKLLELGSAILFAGLALWSYLAGDSWSVLDVRLRVDLGLLLIVVTSLLVRRPFTLAYAKERVPPELWTSPTFLRVNNMITLAWACAFLAIGFADLLMLYAPGVPLWVGIAVTLAALAAAFKFTSWYPERVQAARAG